MSEQPAGTHRIWLVPGLVWLALLILLGLTVGSAYIPLGALNSPINLAIAAVKVSLIVVFFMHLSRSTALLRLAAASSAFWLIIMFTLMFSDYLSRQ
jgi:cytochrome c oxidase subunit 4